LEVAPWDPVDIEQQQQNQQQQQQQLKQLVHGENPDMDTEIKQQSHLESAASSTAASESDAERRTALYSRAPVVPAPDSWLSLTLFGSPGSRYDTVHHSGFRRIRNCMASARQTQADAAVDSFESFTKAALEAAPWDSIGSVLQPRLDTSLQHKSPPGCEVSAATREELASLLANDGD
jgi:hypothetical protein